MKVINSEDRTTVIRTRKNGRYFVGWRRKRVCTGWSLGSAKTYHYQDELKKDLEKLKEKGYMPEVYYVLLMFK